MKNMRKNLYAAALTLIATSFCPRKSFAAHLEYYSCARSSDNSPLKYTALNGSGAWLDGDGSRYALPFESRTARQDDVYDVDGFSAARLIVGDALLRSGRGGVFVSGTG